jgi:cell division protease FtsH
MLFGGRVAEEMIFGPEKITTGAGNDIERATAMARQMVTRFGMSEVIGLMTIGQNEQEVFLGRELTQRREVSEHKAQQVDQEIKRILDESLENTREILKEHEHLLESLAKALLERETLNADEICLLNEGKSLPPLEEEKDMDGQDIESTEDGPKESIESSSTEQDIEEDSSDEKISD